MAYDPFEKKYQTVPVSPPAAVDVTPVSSLDPELQRYNQFLISQNINPNTIGTAVIDPNGGLIVPTVAQEYAAISANHQANSVENKLIRNANIASQRGQTDTAMGYKTQLRDLNNERGSSYESRLAWFLNEARRAAATADYIKLPSANGFSG